MADNVTLNSGSGGETLATDDIAGVQHQRVKVQYGVDGSATDVSDTNPLPIDDAGGSLTVDNAALSVTGGGVEASALRVTLANDSTGVVSVDDNGGSLTVDGTVTANAGTGPWPVTDNGGSLTVDGTVTANAGTGTFTVGTHDVTNAGTFAVQVNGDALTALQTIDNSIFADDAAFTLGSSSVNIAGAIRDDALTTLTAVEGDAVPLRTNSTGALWVNVENADGTATDDAAFTAGTGTGAVMMAYATSDAVDAGDVGAVAMDTSRNLKVSIEADNAGIGGGTQYTEDAAAAADPVGNASILVRADTPATITSADGDNVAQRGTNYGAAYCQIVDSSGNFVDSFGGSGGTAAADDADFTAGTTQGTPVMGVYESSPTSVTDGDLGVAGISSDRRLLVDAQIAGQDADVTIADGGNSITVDGTVTANAGTGPWPVTDNGGSLTVDGTVTANAGTGTFTVDLGSNNDVQGQVAHDAAASGNPVHVGGYATNSIEGLTQVAAGDIARTVHDLNGVLVNRPHTTLEEHISERVSDTGGTSTAFTNFAAGGAGIHNYVCDVTITNTSATDGYVDLRDGTAGSVIWTFPAPANSGATHSFSIPLKGAANTALAYDVSAALTTVYISVNGFQAQG